MKIGDYEKFDISIKQDRHRNPVSTKIRNLEVGHAFVVEGIERTNIMSFIAAIKKSTGRTFGTMKLGVLKHRVYRKS